MLNQPTELINHLQESIDGEIDYETLDACLRSITKFGREINLETSILTTNKERFARFIIRLQRAINMLQLKHNITVFASTTRVGDHTLSSLIGPSIAKLYTHYIAFSLNDPNDTDFMETISEMTISPDSSTEELVSFILDPDNSERVIRIYKFMKNDTYFNMNFTRAMIQHLINAVNFNRDPLSTDTSEMTHLPEVEGIYQEVDVFMNAVSNILTAFKYAYQMYSQDPENTGEWAIVTPDDES